MTAKTGDAAMDEAFQIFNQQLYQRGMGDWQALQTAGKKYFTRVAGNPGQHDLFFNNFAPAVVPLMNRGNFVQAQRTWKSALDIATAWEGENAGQYVHKGTGYYFWGMAALESGDLDAGYLLIHQALAEDLRKNEQVWPGGAAAAFATLDYAEPMQAMKELVNDQAAFVEERLATYRNTRAKTLTIDQVRTSFLSQPSCRAAVFLLVHSVARLRKISLLPFYVLQSDFAGQLEMHVLLGFTLAVEAAIAAKNPSSGMFASQIKYLAQSANLSLEQADVSAINAAQDSDADYDSIAAKLIQASYRRTPELPPLAPLAADIGVAYLVRNRAAHKVNAPSVLIARFSEIVQRIANVFFLTVDTLYP
jgi:hypothetical protein